MSVSRALRYHAAVTLLGHAALRLERLRGERRLRHPRAHELFGPPLRSSARLKELISRHYLAGRYANLRRKVAWVTSGAPVEPLVALGYYVLYPENHGAVCGIRRVAESLCSRAEAAGFSRDLCSYARTDLGAMLSGQTPVGRLPRPDVLVCCTNICQTVLYWYRQLGQHFGVPVAVIDTPFVYRQSGDHAQRYVERQMHDAIALAERIAGRSLDARKLVATTRLSKLACELWMQVLAQGKHRPAPLSAFDQFIHMAPIVEMRGTATTVDYYAGLLAELRQRAAQGIGAVHNERKRLVWDNLPIWPRVRWLSELLGGHGVSLVASTYTQAWGELAPLIDPLDPIRSGAKVHIHPILNRGTGHKLETLVRMVTDFEADGVILHSDRSCKPYSLGQIAQRERLSGELGVPALLLEADHSDPRSFSEQQAATRLTAFMEMLGV
jgi:benzoyl-CoA reductase/2-hydroxyglutaryl-CoA dehydratase subunit BcrC/BadD/HgdB